VTANVNVAQVRGLEGLADLRSLVRSLGFDTEGASYDISDELPAATEAMLIEQAGRRSSGYAVLLVDLAEQPRSFQKLGRHLITDVHDHPLAFCGVRGDGGVWSELVVLRPRWLVTRRDDDRRKEVLEVARLTVDLSGPTAHDLAVLSDLAWGPGDDTDRGRATQDRIDRAFDTRQVTRRFFDGLQAHRERLLHAVEGVCDEPEIKEAIVQAGGSERVSLRLLTQTLFCYFLQRKGLLEGDHHWIAARCREARQRGEPLHRTVIEPLFYDALAKPPDRRPEPWNRRGIPFLNGGLFERLYGDVPLPIPDEVFDPDNGLIGFLEGWTFTVAEENPSEPEVAVDPEMLGKIFESLAPAQEKEAHGIVYTPRPVVRFMCREALVPQLVRRLELTEELARTLLTDDHADDDVVARYGRADARGLFERLDRVAAELTVLDPAVGSGAFLIGMLTELLRLRAMAYRRLHGVEPEYSLQHAWKLGAAERNLFGVDIEPGAVEICKLRLWLSLVVDSPTDPEPLPNLDYRIVCADSLLDYVNRVQVQFTRESGEQETGEIRADVERLTELRHRYFAEADPEGKQRLRDKLRAEEDQVVLDLLERAKKAVPDETQRAELDELAEQFRSHERRMPVFMPGFSAPEVWEAGGWDVVMLNPPYLERKKVAESFPERYLTDLKEQYGRTMDLLAHFGLRSFDYARSGGTVAMIGNDSWFTSTDAADMRFHLFDTRRRLHGLARTRCFEGVAVNGGVFVAEKTPTTPAHDVRWVENHGREPEQMLGASIPAAARRALYPVEGSELWTVPLGEYRRLPHRPAFRPSPEARELIGRYEDCVLWESEFSHLYSGQDRSRSGWGLLPQTRNLSRRQNDWRRIGYYDQLEAGQFILAGLVIEGGQGLATADDRRFLAVLDGTPEAEDVRERQDEYLQRASTKTAPAARLAELRAEQLTNEQALGSLNAEFTPQQLGWPRSGLIRLADPNHVHAGELTEELKQDGIPGSAHWVPFEKGDQSEEGGGARWVRDNPLVIDWSPEIVALLRHRARHGPHRPYFRNEHAWGRAGATWNRVASYLRARRVPAGAIFSDMAPTVVPLPECSWLTANVLLALLNSSAADFCLRTFVGSRMHIEVGDVREIPLPVLDAAAASELDGLVEDAVAAKLERDAAEVEAKRQDAAERLREIEGRIDARVLDLYGLQRDADLWVVR
jgi:hypothetical protein